MKHFVRNALIAAGPVLVVAMAQSGPAFANPDERAAIESRLQQYEARFNEEDAVALDVPPLNRTVFGWNFPLMIPGWGKGEFHEVIEVFGGADRVRVEAG